jgi:putative copper export protein
MSGDALADILLVTSRVLWYVGCLGVIGAGAFRLLVTSAPVEGRRHSERHAATIGFVAAIVLLLGTLARLYAQAYASFGLDEPMTARLLLEVATDLPPWSTGWTWQVLAGVVSAAAFSVARAGRRAGWAAAYLGALAVAASAPLTGHAVAQADWYRLPLTLQAAHVLGAGVWIGGLFVLLVVGLRTPRRERAGPAPAATLVAAFSPVALAGAGVLALSGVVTTSLYLDALADLWTTGYGRTLLLKITMFLAVGLVGFLNWQYVRPRLAREDGPALLQRSATIELVLAALVLVATALLVGLPQPGG